MATMEFRRLGLALALQLVWLSCFGLPVKSASLDRFPVCA